MQNEMNNGLPEPIHREPLENAVQREAPPIALRGLGPVVGMECPADYKEIGDDCVFSNVEFE